MAASDAFEAGRVNGRVDGLIDIAQEKNHRFIRQPVDSRDAHNIPGASASREPRLLSRHCFGEVIEGAHGLRRLTPIEPITANSATLTLRLQDETSTIEH